MAVSVFTEPGMRRPGPDHGKLTRQAVSAAATNADTMAFSGLGARSASRGNVAALVRFLPSPVPGADPRRVAV